MYYVNTLCSFMLVDFFTFTSVFTRYFGIDEVSWNRRDTCTCADLELHVVLGQFLVCLLFQSEHLVLGVVPNMAVV